MNTVLANLLGNAVSKVLDRILGSNPDQQALKNAGDLIKLAQTWADTDRSGAWIQRSWRPALMWTCIMVLVLYLIVDPLLGLILDKRVPPPNLESIPEHVWEILLWSIGIYSAGRTVEKTVKYRAEQKVQTPVQFESKPKPRMKPTPKKRTTTEIQD